MKCGEPIHWPKNNLNLRKKLKPVHRWSWPNGMCLAQKPDIYRCIRSICDRLSFYQRFKLFLGQCTMYSIYKVLWLAGYRQHGSRLPISIPTLNIIKGQTIQWTMFRTASRKFLIWIIKKTFVNKILYNKLSLCIFPG